WGDHGRCIHNFGCRLYFDSDLRRCCFSDFCCDLDSFGWGRCRRDKYMNDLWLAACYQCRSQQKENYSQSHSETPVHGKRIMDCSQRVWVNLRWCILTICIIMLRSMRNWLETNARLWTQYRSVFVIWKASQA